MTAPLDRELQCWNISDFKDITGTLGLLCCRPPCILQTVSKHVV